MLKYSHKYGTRIFLAPDGVPSGGSGNPAAGQGGHQPAQAGAGPIDPFAGMDFDDFPPEVKAQMTKAKEQFATLQTQNQQATEKAEKAEKASRQFQAQTDRIQAELKRLAPAPQQQQSPQEAMISQIEGILVKKGIPMEQAKLQAPIHAELLTLQGDALKKEIGAGLGPMMGTVLQQQANSAWQQVAMNDRLGAFQIPAVAEATWAGVQHLIAQGQEVTPETINNLRGMHYAAHLEQGGQIPQLQQPPSQQQFMPQPQQQPQYPNTASRFTYPGAGNFAQQQQVPDQNAPRHKLNEDTRAALANTFARMGPNQPTMFKK